MFVGSLCHLSPQISVILPLPIVDIMAMVQQYVPSIMYPPDGSFRPKKNLSWSDYCWIHLINRKRLLLIQNVTYYKSFVWTKQHHMHLETCVSQITSLLVVTSLAPCGNTHLFFTCRRAAKCELFLLLVSLQLWSPFYRKRKFPIFGKVVIWRFYNSQHKCVYNIRRMASYLSIS